MNDWFALIFTFVATFVVGALFGYVVARRRKARRNDHKTWYCPNGHGAAKAADDYAPFYGAKKTED